MPKPETILQLDLGREWRGGQRQVLYLCRHLAHSGKYRPIIATPEGSPLADAAREAEVEVISLPSRFEWHPGSIYKLLRRIASDHIRFVQTHCARSASLGAALKVLSREDFALIHSRRVSYRPGRGWSHKKYDLADAVVCVSAEIAETMRESGLEPEHVSVIHSGIDPRRYPRHVIESKNSLHVGMVGALTPQKGHGVFLNALGLMNAMRDVPDWHASIVGDGRLRKDLEMQAKKLGLEASVRFLGYRESSSVLPDFDLLVVPSVDGEGSSGVIKEGWAAGVPVVCSDLPSNLELVEPGKSGESFRSQDTEALALLLADLMQDAQREGDWLPNLVAQGDERLKLFTDVAMAESYMRLYARFVA
ncbi:glycosyltransferase [Desulfobaculum bizertense]|uniref:Glycosyltransferase involved in cell wall bisynthesis n=1 Tax=Desulfobaculum bizertense DSM 18034 TaxID=1121442 RepID=A0A1T4VP41_9BACT|nr:glycosyltransferase [Desulfobaculum bizertense]UIJ38168.1 glycosyltransferase [Desulfobaculum bizertense]SKA66689.1 Glycosyltransferase involved in cell wall bisynthesis [Desulfobaculum bizertense DSM 18034]